MLDKIIESEIENFKAGYEPFVRKVPESIELSRYIDHTLLKSDATVEMIKKLCEEAIQYDFWSVCLNSGYLPLAQKFLEGKKVKKTVVVGFPLGQMASQVKRTETLWSLKMGADEFDMVMNIGLLKSREYQSVFDDIAGVIESAMGKVVKVIIETCLLSETEKIAACVISREAGADFVKTSTGFSTGGATVDDVSLMKYVVDGRCKVKASGGIKTRQDALKMIEAGADRIGTSSGIKIVKRESEENQGGY